MPTVSHKRRDTVGVSEQQREQLRAVARYYGVFSRVAKRLGLDRSHVRKVALGERQSRPVERALRAELDRLETSRPSNARPKAERAA